MSTPQQGRWTPVSKHEPCPACGGTDWCAWTPDGQTLRCMRSEKANCPPGLHPLGTDKDGGELFGPPRLTTRPKQRRSHRHDRHTVTALNSNGAADSTSVCRRLDLSAMLDSLRDQLIDAKLRGLADATGLPASAWSALKPGWANKDDLRKLRAGGKGWNANGGGYPDGAYVFAEYDGKGRLVGLALRTVDGRKGAPASSIGSRRGLIVPPDFHERVEACAVGTTEAVSDGRVSCGPFVVEGASDVAACIALGLPAVGRPSNRSGATDLADLLAGMDDVTVVGERDGKEGGAWPGRDGAVAVSRQLASRWAEPVAWTMPPTGTKDLRDWFQRHPGGKAADLVDGLHKHRKQTKPARHSAADVLVELATATYRMGVTDTGEAFAVEHDGPNVALLLKGSATALRAKLAKAYRAKTGKTSPSAALADALTALQGLALDAESEPLALRVAAVPVADDEDDAASETPPSDSTGSSAGTGGGVVIDLGDAAGRAAVVESDGVTVVSVAPVLFRRTALTGALPAPDLDAEPADLLQLRELLNVDDDSWPLVVGWLVAACLPDIPHPVLMLGGQQGTGKSTAARLLTGLLDPSPAPLRSEPREPKDWAMSAAGGWCVVVDNVSRIPAWWSDALCKAVTGDGWVSRKLYTDDDLSVLSFRRCIAITSIDTGAMRGDLADRLLIADLEPITGRTRRTEAELNHHYRHLQPTLTGALLKAVSATLAALPSVELDDLPRMADFARVLAALDAACPELTGRKAFDRFARQRDRIAADVVEGDPFAAAVAEFTHLQSGLWTGTAGDLLQRLQQQHAMQDATERANHPNLHLKATPWTGPKTPRGLAGQLMRYAPALARVGVHVTKSDTRSNRGQTYELRAENPAEKNATADESTWGEEGEL